MKWTLFLEIQSYLQGHSNTPWNWHFHTVPFCSSINIPRKKENLLQKYLTDKEQIINLPGCLTDKKNPLLPWKHSHVSENQDAQAQKVSVRFFDQKGRASSFFLGFVLLSKIKNLEKKKSIILLPGGLSWQVLYVLTSFVCLNTSTPGTRWCWKEQQERITCGTSLWPKEEAGITFLHCNICTAKWCKQQQNFAVISF